MIYREIINSLKNRNPSECYGGKLAKAEVLINSIGKAQLLTTINRIILQFNKTFAYFPLDDFCF